MISGLDSQSKFQIFTLFSERHVGCPLSTPTWRLHTGFCKFVQNFSTNIWSLGRHADLKLGEVSYLFISYNTLISCLYTLNGFRIIFNCVTVQPKNLNQTSVDLIKMRTNFNRTWESTDFLRTERIRSVALEHRSKRQAWSYLKYCKQPTRYDWLNRRNPQHRETKI